MRIALLTVGSQGDVQPFLALARGMIARGFEVVLATGAHFEPLIRSHQIPFRPLRADFLEFIQSPEGKEILRGNKWKAISLWRSKIVPMTRELLDDAWQAVQDCDAIIYHPKVLAGPHLAERLSIPVAIGFFLPVLTATRIRPMPLLTSRDLGSWLNRESYALMRFASLPFRGVINDWRRERLGLSSQSWSCRDDRVAGKPIPVLYAYSEAMIPRPADWPASAQVTGFWFLDDASEATPAAELEAFLNRGEPPIYVGFGSMASRDPQPLTEMIIQALEKTDQRGVLATGWGGLSSSTRADSILSISAVSHRWLFPRVAAVVHHGGAGTTAAGLRAGKPTLICPFFADQPFWGRTVHRLGVGPEPIPQRKLSVDRLARAIDQMRSDSLMIDRANRLGERIEQENGVERAIDWLQRWWKI